MRELVTVPNPVLLRSGRLLDLDNPEDIALIKELVRDMRIGMRRWKGAGLTACQIGEPVDLFVMNTRTFSEARKLSVFINTIVHGMGRMIERVEGCLSIPGKKFRILRYPRVEIITQTLNGKTKTKQFDGWAAACIQQEADHVRGILLSMKGKEVTNG